MPQYPQETLESNCNMQVSRWPRGMQTICSNVVAERSRSESLEYQDAGPAVSSLQPSLRNSMIEVYKERPRQLHNNGGRTAQELARQRSFSPQRGPHGVMPCLKKSYLEKEQIGSAREKRDYV